MRGSDAGASKASVAERSRSCEGATCADAIVTDPALPEQTDASLPDSVIILLYRNEIHEPMVLTQPLLNQFWSSIVREEQLGFTHPMDFLFVLGLSLADDFRFFVAQRAPAFFHPLGRKNDTNKDNVPCCRRLK
jgi:hypothetical protein